MAVNPDELRARHEGSQWIRQLMTTVYSRGPMKRRKLFVGTEESDAPMHLD